MKTMDCKDCLYQMVNHRCGVKECPYRVDEDDESEQQGTIENNREIAKENHLKGTLTEKHEPAEPLGHA